jgi:DNA-binding MarR family transcriptional regulator
MMSIGIGFLISDVSRLLRRRFDEQARSIGVTRAQWRALTALSRQEGLNQGKLAELLEVEPISLCRMIDRLEEAGHVTRRRDPSDRRAWNIFLTEKSRPLLDRLHDISADVVGAALHGISEQERAAMAASLEHMREHLNRDPSKDQTAHG